MSWLLSTSVPTASTWSSARYSHGQLVIIDRLREMVRLARRPRRPGPPRPRSRRRARSPAWSASASACATCRPSACASSAPTRCARRAASGASSSARARRSATRSRSSPACEEARLIYLGVAHTTPSDGGHRLVVDIGGGSTELIIGEGLEPLQPREPHMGCVSMSAQLLRRRQDHREALQARARLAAQLELEPVMARVPASGLGRGVRQLRARCARSATCSGARRAERRRSPREGLEWLLERCLRAGRRARLELAGARRASAAEFLPGGVAISPRSSTCSASSDARRRRRAARRPALRHDRPPTDEDARERTVRSMAGALPRRRARRPSASRPPRSALLAQVRRDLGPARRRSRELAAALGSAAARDRPRRRARAATTGTAPTCSQYADMPGFTREEQRLLAVLVGGHRRKLHREQYEDLVPPWHLKARIADRAAPARGAAAPRARAALAARDPSRCTRPLTGTGVPDGLARGASTDRRRPRAGDRLPARRRLSPAGRLKPVAVRSARQRLASRSAAASRS